MNRKYISAAARLGREIVARSWRTLAVIAVLLMPITADRLARADTSTALGEPQIGEFQTRALIAYCRGDSKAFELLLPIVMPVASALAGRVPNMTPHDLAVGAFGNIWKRLCSDELAAFRIIEMDVPKYLKAATRNRFFDLWGAAHPKGSPAITSLAEVHEHEDTLRSMNLDPEEMLEQERRIVAATEYARQTTSAIYRAAAVMRQRDGMLNSAVAEIFEKPPSTITSGIEAMRKKIKSVLSIDEPITPQIIKNKFGLDIGNLPDVADVLGQGEFNYDSIAPTDGLPNNVYLSQQSSGEALWSKGVPLPIQDVLMKAGDRIKFVANGDDYYGYSMQMVLPPGIVSRAQGVLVSTPLALSPPDSGQRMLVAGARYVRTLANGDAVYDLEAYCLDEHREPPITGAGYTFHEAEQKIVSAGVKDAVRSEGSFEQKGLCIWKAISGEAAAAGTCRVSG